MPLHIHIGMRNAEQAREPRTAQTHRDALRQEPGLLDDFRGACHTAGNFDEQRGGALDGSCLPRRIDSALETLARIGVQTVAARAPGEATR